MSMSDEHVMPVLPLSVRWGRGLLALGVAGLIGGKRLVRALLPNQVGAGADGVALAILIPIWSIGIAGLLLLFFAWAKYPGLETKLDTGHGSRPDGKVFGPFTRWLAVFTIAFVWVVMFGLWSEIELISRKILFSYFMTAYAWFMIYMLVLYRPRHRATTTYVNLFTILFAILLIPFTWLLLIILNRRVIRQAEIEAGETTSDSEIFSAIE